MQIYNYKANVKGEQVTTTSIRKLATIINDKYEFQIVTADTLNNYFTRPHTMKLKAARLESLGLERFVVGLPQPSE